MIRICEYCRSVHKDVEFRTNHAMFLCAHDDQKLTDRIRGGLSDLDKSILNMNDRFTKDHDSSGA
jgi:hypothetical protein